MNPLYRVQEALNHPEDDDIDVTAYDPLVEEASMSMAGSRVPAIRVITYSREGQRNAMAALNAANIQPARSTGADDIEPPIREQGAAGVIHIPVSHIEDEPIVLEFPEARDFEPTEVSWDNVFYPAERVELHLATGDIARRPAVTGSARYFIEFMDTRGTTHDLVRNLGNPKRENGDTYTVRFEQLEEQVEALRKNGVPKRALWRLD